MTAYESSVPISKIAVSAYTIPTDYPEQDGTFDWDSTMLLLVEATGGETTGLGYTYADTATARLIAETLTPVVTSRDAMDIPGCWMANGARYS